MTLVSSRSANMSSGLLLDPLPSPSSEATPPGTRYKPYATPNHHVTKGRYITSNDPRGYIPVYEYPLNGQWIMLDMDDGYVLWTGIWKALGNSKADIVKMVESQPDLAPQLRRVRGGYLKIQGTWMPYEIALRLARRVAWPIRYELVPLFGPTFPDTCLSPDQPGFGQIVKPGAGKRRTRRAIPAGNPPDAKHDWTVISPAPHPTVPGVGPYCSASRGLPHDLSHQSRRHSEPDARRRGIQEQDVGSPIALHSPYEQPFHRPTTASTSYSHSETNRDLSPAFPPPAPGGRYSPYPNPHGPRPRVHSSRPDHYYSLPSPPHGRHIERQSSYSYSHNEDITLPPIKPLNEQSKPGNSSSLTLPPISALDSKSCDDSTAVLRRLQSSSDDIPVVRVNIPGARNGSSEYQPHSPTTLSSPHSGPQTTGARLPSLRLPANPPSGPNSSPITAPFTHQSGNSSQSHSPVSPLLRTPHSATSSRDDDSPAYQSPIRERGILPAPKGEDKPYALYHNRMEHGIPIGESIHCSGDDLPPYPTRHAWRPW